MNAIDFIFAGKAYFTIYNENNGHEFSYKMEWKDKYHSYIISVMDRRTGSMYGIGYYNNVKKFVAWKDSVASRAFAWFIEALLKNDVPSFITIEHHGLCGRCGAQLKDPDSVTRGFGAQCYSLHFTDPPLIFEEMKISLYDQA